MQCWGVKKILSWIKYVLQKKENCIRTIVKQIMNQPQENKIIMAGKIEYKRREKRVTSNRT